MQPQHYIPWLGSIVVESILLFVIFRKRVQKRFPVFFAYVTYDLLRAIIVPAIAFFRPHTYFYLYWFSFPVEYTLTLLIVLEVFAYIFRLHIKHSPRTVRLFVLFAIVLLVCSIALVVFPDIRANTGTVLALDRSMELLICGLLLFMWAFSRTLGLSWRHHVWGIVFGLAIYSSVGLAVAAIHAATGRLCPSWITPLPHFAYLAATLIWTGYLLRTEPKRAPLTSEQINAYRDLILVYQTIVSDIRKAIR